MTGTPSGERLRVEGLTRSYPGVLALDDVGLVAHSGEVLGVVGENGAGKSTLMKLLAGIESPDAGQMLVDGAPWRPQDPRQSLDDGVALVHQELCLAENLSAADNIALGREPRTFGFVDRGAVRELATDALARVDAHIDPQAIVATLSAGERQLVEIAKGLAIGARIVILDEPTSSLTGAESAALFDVVRRLQREGTLVLYVSHRLGEIDELCDRVVVLRDGKTVGEYSEWTRAELVQCMVARPYERGEGRRSAPEPMTEIRLRARGLRTADWPGAELDFDIGAGEIVGVAGLVGAGRTELLETLFGLRSARGGALELDREVYEPRSPRDAIDAGVALAPEDRKEHGLLLEDPVRVNFALATLRSRRRGPFVHRQAETAAARAHLAELGVRASSIDQIAGTLSGGNQQKVVLGRWLEAGPRLLLLDEPTRGVDVGAREEIYRILERLAANGVSVLFASSDLEEVLRLASRVLVMHEGALVGDLAPGDMTETRIMELATGGTRATEVPA